LPGVERGKGRGKGGEGGEGALGKRVKQAKLKKGILGQRNTTSSGD